MNFNFTVPNRRKNNQKTLDQIQKEVAKKAAHRRKIKAVIEQHPEIDLRMVFQAPFNKISKKSKTTYAKWCDKHGIPWCSFSNIPLEWLI